LWKYINYPTDLVGSLKVDGSSITIWYKNGEYGIASRNLSKPLTIKKIVGRRELNLFDKVLMFFGKKIDLNITEEVESDSDFVKAGKPYLDKLVNYCKENNLNIALRGELNGGQAKGSGNKNNPASKEALNIKFFGADWYDFNTSKMSYLHFKELMEKLDFPRCKEIFNQTFNSKEELVNVCETYFEKNMVEGIVVRNMDSTTSFKYMNKEYDSKK
jgi:hypothetical protein